MDPPCLQVSQTVELVEEGACRLAGNLMAGWLVLSKGQCMGKRGVCRGQPASFVFGGIGSKHHQGHRRQAREDRASNPRLTGLCSFDLDWWKQLAAGSWLGKTRGA